MEKKKKRMIRSCFQEYIMKISSTRFLSAVVLMITLVCAAASGVDRLMADAKEWITPWMAPHFFDNLYFVTFYGFIICYMYSDVPFMNRGELYKVLRKGRLSWCMEKIVSIFLQALTMDVLTMAASALVFIPKLKFSAEWGKIIYTMAFSESIYEYALLAEVSRAVITKYTPMQAMLLCFFMVFLVSSLIGLLMFAISLYSNQILAVASSTVLAALNLSSAKFITVKWLAYVTPLNWCRISLYGEQILGGITSHHYPSAKLCIIVSSIIILFLMIVIILRSKRIEYIWNKEE